MQHAPAHEAVRASHGGSFEKVREPYPHGCPLHGPVQLRVDQFRREDGSGNGGWYQRPALGNGRPEPAGLLGANVGYNWLVLPQWVVGIEGNWDWSNIRGNDGGSGGDVNAVDQNWQAGVRARAGFLVTPSTMLFGTGGLAFMDADLKDEDIPQLHSAMFNGWTFGGGIEQEILPNITGRLEYRWSDFSQKRVSFASFYDIGATPKINAVIAGVSWHF